MFDSVSDGFDMGHLRSEGIITVHVPRMRNNRLVSTFICCRLIIGAKFGSGHLLLIFLLVFPLLLFGCLG